METASAGFGSAYEASVAGAAGGAGAIETVSEGFGPVFESSVAGSGGTVGAAVETASEGFGPAYESSLLPGGSSVFNAAADSQLASTQMGITGSEAAVDGAASVPSVASGGSSLMDNPLLRTLGTKALEMGLGSVASSLLAPGGDTDVSTTPPALPKPLPMPDPLSSILDTKRSTARNAKSRHGRKSTILTRT
jgi:hypothetical protein